MFFRIILLALCFISSAANADTGRYNVPPITADILYSDASQVQMDDVIKAIRQSYPAPHVISERRGQGERAGSTIIDLDGNKIIVAAFPTPIDPRFVQKICGLNNLQKLLTCDEIKSHKSHMLVGYLRVTAPPTEAERHLELSRIVSSILAIKPAHSVVWGMDMGAITPAQIFMDTMSKLDKDSLPFPFWIALHATDLKDGQYLVVTRGLPDFNRKDIEVTFPQLDQMKRAIATASVLEKYLISGDVGPEDKLGVPGLDGKEIPVTVEPSTFYSDPTKPVYRVRLN